jgi:hypothetical protein
MFELQSTIAVKNLFLNRVKNENAALIFKGKCHDHGLGDWQEGAGYCE